MKSKLDLKTNNSSNTMIYIRYYLVYDLKKVIVRDLGFKFYLDNFIYLNRKKIKKILWE